MNDRSTENTGLLWLVMCVTIHTIELTAWVCSHMGKWVKGDHFYMWPSERLAKKSHAPWTSSCCCGNALVSPAAARIDIVQSNVGHGYIQLGHKKSDDTSWVNSPVNQPCDSDWAVVSIPINIVNQPSGAMSKNMFNSYTQWLRKQL